MKHLLFFAGIAIAFLSIREASAQQPSPAMVVVAAATASQSSVAPPTNTANAENSSSLQAAVKALQQAKAANAETLKRQEATLQQLDDLQKAAEQLKVFAKRG